MVACYFIVAVFEISSFSGIHFALGLWYKSDEIGRRGDIFYVGLTPGTITAGHLQAAASKNLDGVNS
ncbi:hypothetical protein BKA61DRAFT_688072 [Leptodontidium sp. MPI-SDFR-AT-0119]|nr:hypothetical protein BKA61DRAFT_688072 [Leptodontidium sp. MPI-SDFR-AT-0119]